MHFFSAEQLDTNGKFMSLQTMEKKHAEREREREKLKLTHPNNPQGCGAYTSPNFSLYRWSFIGVSQTWHLLTVILPGHNCLPVELAFLYYKPFHPTSLKTCLSDTVTLTHTHTPVMKLSSKHSESSNTICTDAVLCALSVDGDSALCPSGLRRCSSQNDLRRWRCRHFGRWPA